MKCGRAVKYEGDAGTIRATTGIPIAASQSICGAAVIGSEVEFDGFGDVANALEACKNAGRLLLKTFIDEQVQLKPCLSLA